MYPMPYKMYLNPQQQKFLREHCPERNPFCQDCAQEFYEEMLDLQVEE